MIFRATSGCFAISSSSSALIWMTSSVRGPPGCGPRPLQDAADLAEDRAALAEFGDFQFAFEHGHPAAEKHIPTDSRGTFHGDLGVRGIGFAAFAHRRPGLANGMGE